MGYSSGTIGRKAYPGKLGSHYSPVGLWLFDGTLTDSGTTGENLSLARGEVHYAYLQDSDKRSLSVDDQDGLEGVSSPAPASLRVSGDVTVQFLYTPIKNEPGTAGSALFICGGSGSLEANNELYSLLLDGTAGSITPIFRWEHGAGTRVTVTDVAFNMTPGRPQHIVGRRFSDGVGTSTGQLWVNGVLIAELTGQTNPTGGTSSPIYLGREAAGNVAIQIAALHAIKVVDRSLTDEELLDEFLRTGTATELT